MPGRHKEHREQLAVEHQGKEPGPRTLAALIDQVRREGIGTVFVQKQFGSALAEVLASEIGGAVVTLDPLSADYQANLLSAARAIAEAGRP